MFINWEDYDVKCSITTLFKTPRQFEIDFELPLVILPSQSQTTSSKLWYLINLLMFIDNQSNNALLPFCVYGPVHMESFFERYQLINRVFFFNLS